MKHLFLFAACAMLLAIPRWGQADDTAAPPPLAEVETIAAVDALAILPVLKVELKTLRIVNGKASLCAKTRCYGAISLKRLAPDIAVVAREFPKATYATDGRTLVIGINERGKQANATLIEIAWQSDCPDNSQYQARIKPAQLAKVRRPQLRDALVAWTRDRHDTPQAALRRLRQENDQHWDVQLSLR